MVACGGHDHGDQFCRSNHDCDASLVCDLAGSKQCVMCTAEQAQACTGEKPTCGDDQTCRPCGDDDECPATKLCVPSGSCETAAYVDSSRGSDNPDCSRAMPCKTIAAGLATKRPYLRLHGAFDEHVTVDGGCVVTLLADPGTTLTNQGGGAILTVTGDNTQLTVEGLTLGNTRSTDTKGVYVPAGSGAPNVTLIQVTITKCTAEGISVAGGSLTVAQSVVSLNPRGGIVVTGSARFVIVGNQLWGNGTNDSPYGGIGIATREAPGNRLELNSFYKNASQDGIGAAIQCVAGQFTARNNVMVANGSPTNPEQVGGTCGHAYSITAPGTLPPGPGNQATDPLFVNPATGDLHLQPGSPAACAADPHADLSGIAAHDRDGHLRIQPASIGAYQYLDDKGQPRCPAYPVAGAAR